MYKKYIIASVVLTVVVALSGFSQTHALTLLGGTNVGNLGNGDGSYNKAWYTNTKSTVVGQTNSALQGNSVANSTNTGGNKAKRNTGGTVVVGTSTANTTVNTTNTANSNAALVSDCGCLTAEGTTVSNVENGSDSVNIAKFNNTSNTSVGQSNNAAQSNQVVNSTNSGGNNASRNTGGDVTVVSGGANTTINTTNTANTNEAVVGPAVF